MKHLKLKPLWLSIGYAMVVFVIYSSLISDPVVIDIDFDMQDKVMHVVGYFGLMGWFIQIYQQQKTRYILAAVFITMGIGLEFLQDFGGVRYFEVSDMFANIAGVLLAWLLAKTSFAKLLFWFEARLIR